jgi:hypothetical protein
MGTRTRSDDWEQRRDGAGCPMCTEGRPDDTGAGIRFFEGAVSDGYLQRSAPGTQSSSGAAVMSQT